MQDLILGHALEGYERVAADRAEAMKKVYLTGAYMLKATVDHFGVHYRVVSRVVNR